MLPLSALAFATLQTVTECMGCHTPMRDVPPSTFQVGLGHWTESDCFGCHREINDVLHEGVVEKRTSARFWALPVASERREELAQKPLSFMAAPGEIGLSFGPYERIDTMRLLAFLRQPVDMQSHGGGAAPEADRMMAYPRLTADDVPELLGLSTTPASTSRGASASAAGRTSATDAAKGEAAALWESRCKACHETIASASGRPPEYLALFTPEWISGYASGTAAYDGRPRTMPVIPVSMEAATGLYELFGARRDATASRLKARVEKLDTRAVDARTRGRKLTDGEIERVSHGFLREGKCVHCHAAKDHRASDRFFASPEGLAAYVGEHGGLEVWRRLEVRALETHAGMTAEASGMPMASDAVPPELRDLVYVWAREGCPIPRVPNAPATAKRGVLRACAAPATPHDARASASISKPLSERRK